MNYLERQAEQLIGETIDAGALFVTEGFGYSGDFSFWSILTFFKDNPVRRPSNGFDGYEGEVFVAITNSSIIIFVTELTLNLIGSPDRSITREFARSARTSKASIAFDSSKRTSARIIFDDGQIFKVNPVGDQEAVTALFNAAKVN